MLPNGKILESPVHQDDLRHYDSKDISQFYYGNRINNTNDDDDDPPDANSSTINQENT